MRVYHLVLPAVLAGAFALSLGSALAQYRTGPVTPAELEQTYNIMIEHRTASILEALHLNDSNQMARVQNIIMTQYRSLRARDEAIDSMLKVLDKNAPGTATNRAAIVELVSRPLHDQFLTRLAGALTPEQVELVKDKMTYGKVKFTYDAYNSIVPNLSDADKAEIMKLLKQARDEAIDGGSAGEKSEIFAKYKVKINAYLDAHGHDVARAMKEWKAKQLAAKAEKTNQETGTPSN